MNPTNSRARYQTHLEHCNLPELKKKYDSQWETLTNVDEQEKVKEGFSKLFEAYDSINIKKWKKYGNASNPLLNMSKSKEGFTSLDHKTMCNLVLLIVFILFVLYFSYNKLPSLGVTYSTRQNGGYRNW